MFELDHDLVQDIVDRAMTILPYNVNVMDNQGLILGSGERERINTRHEGAQLVLANGRVVEIDENTAAKLKGVQPGINVPLMLDLRIIGVLGLTGEPEQLRTYAELVRMTAEMQLVQRNQQAEQQWRRQRCDDLLALLLDDAGDSPRLLDEARQMGLKPQLPRVPYLFELGLENGPEQTAQALGGWLMSRYPDTISGQLVSDLLQIFLALVPTGQRDGGERTAAGQARWARLEYFSNGFGRPGRRAVGFASLLPASGRFARLWAGRIAAVTPTDPRPLSTARNALAPSQR